MHCAVPDIRLATELPHQTAYEDKLGGLPWGLPQALWPTCAQCGQAQSLLAQFVHAPGRLDLGREGRVLSIFQCNHNPGECETWSLDAGANAVVITEPEDLLQELTPAPSGTPIIEREARVIAWLDMEDGLPEADARLFYNDEDLGELDENKVVLPLPITRLGSVPSWQQSADEGPGAGWRFVGQLDGDYSFFTPPEAGTKNISKPYESIAGRTHVCEGPNFGDAGCAYLFLRDGEGAPEGKMLWQCT
jgi:hypothetical protein